MTNRSRTGLIIAVVTAVVFFLMGLCSKAQAQSLYPNADKRGVVYFKMGGNSTIPNSAVESSFNVGFGGGYQLFEKVNLYVEPSLALNLPKKELVNFQGTTLQVSTKTMLVDFNGTYVVAKGHFINPYVTGGVGVLRNSATISDGYSGFNLGSDNHLTKNVGGGLRLFVKGPFFVGGEFRKYWTAGGGFKTYHGTVGIVF